MHRPHGWALSLLSAVVLQGCATTPAPAGQMFVGELQSITLNRQPNVVRRGERLILTNSCGEESASLRVIQSNSRLAVRQQLRFRLGEWCDLPIEFPHRHWLIIRTESSTPVALPVFVAADAAFAVIDSEEKNRTLSTWATLPRRQLPEPIEYPDRDRSELDRLVARNPDLELRDGKVWIVRGIPLSEIFQGFSVEDLRA